MRLFHPFSSLGFSLRLPRVFSSTAAIVRAKRPVLAGSDRGTTLSSSLERALSSSLASNGLTI